VPPWSVPACKRRSPLPRRGVRRAPGVPDRPTYSFDRGADDHRRDLDAAGVALRSATEPIDTQGPVGRMLLQLLGIFAEFERGLLIDRITKGFERKAARGEWLGGPGPFGLPRRPSHQDPRSRSQRSRNRPKDLLHLRRRAPRRDDPGKPPQRGRATQPRRPALEQPGGSASAAQPGITSARSPMPMSPRRQAPVDR